MVCARRLKFVILLVVFAAVSPAAEWTALTPAARCAARMCVDSANQRLILFGGTTVYMDGRYFNDVWEVPLDNPGYYPWLPVRPTGSPPAARADHCLVYDQAGERMVLFGGASAIGHFLNDVWTLNLSPGSESWQQSAPSGAPPAPRAYAYPIYCPTRRSVIVFGGSDGRDFGDLWELKLDTLEWRSISPSGARPSARRDGAAIYDAAGNRMVIFGGRMGGGFTDELWALDLTPGSENWTQLAPTGSAPSARAGFASGQTWDGSKLYVSCGWNASNLFSDLYELNLASVTWTYVNVGGNQPVGRRNTCGVYDPFTANFFIFGGEWDIGVYLGDAYFADCAPGAVREPVWQHPGLVGPGLSVTPISGGAARIHCLVTRACDATVSVFDATGREVREVFSGRVNVGGVWLGWDGKDGLGRAVAPGTYYCTMNAGSTIVSRKLVMAR